jgi:hypothetical protein
VSHLPREIPEASAGAPSQPTVPPADLELATANTSDIILEATYVEELLREADVDDPTVLDLIERGQAIREELRRREAALVPDCRWDIRSSRSSIRPAGHAQLSPAMARNARGRGGSNGPGRWNDD